jgi:GT2 family glycosyltransferase
VIGHCLDAALSTGAPVVVVDNASSDGTPELARRAGVHLIANRSNRGFAAAVNQGFSILQTTYVLLLNPDVLLENNLAPLREACDLPRAAGAGGCLVDESGEPQTGFMVRKFPTPAVLALEALLLNRAWPNNPVNAAYRGLRLDYSAVQAVEQPAGAFLMIRRTVWEKLGGFDECFWPLWFEDVDFCRRAAELGYLWYYTPGAVCRHTGGHSIVKLALEMRLVYWYGSVLRYSAKHFRPSGVRAVCVAVISGSLLRILPETALRRSLKPVVAYSKVIWLAGRYFFGRRDIAVASVSGP